MVSLLSREDAVKSLLLRGWIMKLISLGDPPPSLELPQRRHCSNTIPACIHRMVLLEHHSD